MKGFSTILSILCLMTAYQLSYSMQKGAGASAEMPTSRSVTGSGAGAESPVIGALKEDYEVFSKAFRFVEVCKESEFGKKFISNKFEGYKLPSDPDAMYMFTFRISGTEIVPFEGSKRGSTSSTSADKNSSTLSDCCTERAVLDAYDEFVKAFFKSKVGKNAVSEAAKGLKPSGHLPYVSISYQLFTPWFMSGHVPYQFTFQLEVPSAYVKSLRASSAMTPSSSSSSASSAAISTGASSSSSSSDSTTSASATSSLSGRTTLSSSTSAPSETVMSLILNHF